MATKDFGQMVDNDTIKPNAGGELYVDSAELAAALADGVKIIAKDGKLTTSPTTTTTTTTSETYIQDADNNIFVLPVADVSNYMFDVSDNTFTAQLTMRAVIDLVLVCNVSEYNSYGGEVSIIKNDGSTLLREYIEGSKEETRTLTVLAELSQGDSFNIELSTAKSSYDFTVEKNSQVNIYKVGD